MLSQILTIARTTFIESIRQPVYFLLIVIAGLAMLLTTWSTGFSLGYSEAGEVSGDNKLLLDVCLATVFLAGTLIAAFIATSAISREIENKTVLTVVSKPVPRPVLVIGKYFGVSGALIIAIVQMVIFLLLALRHGVMTNASQEVDMPVVVFSFSALGIALFVAMVGNFLYGWHFAQTAALLTLPLMILAYVLVLMISPKWEIQPLLKDFKPQSLLACIGVVMAVLVLGAAAIAASTRLGQVMTIVVCFGLFLLGLMSNFLLGDRAYVNDPVARIAVAKPERDRFESFTGSGDIYEITLRSGPKRAIRAGQPIWYGPAANGSANNVPDYEPYAGPLGSDEMVRVGTKPALIVTNYDASALKVTIRNIGGTGLPVKAPPKENDYLFDQPTKLNAPALVVWGLIPNFQFSWLLDAVAQNQPIPLRHIALLGFYTLTWITAMLSLAVLLFQKRDVG